MIIKAHGGDLLEGKVVREGWARLGQSCASLCLLSGCGRLLEFLVLVDDLYAMLVLLFGGLVAHIGKMAIDRHDGGRCRMTGITGRASR